MVHATGHHPFEGIMSFRDKSKLSTAQHVKNRTSNKTNNQKCKIQSDFPFPILLLFCQTGRQKTAKKATCLSDSYLFPRLDLVQGGFWEANPPLEFSTNISKSLAVNHYSSWKPSWVFQGSFFELLVVFIFVGKKKPEWTGTPSIGGVERWFRPRTLAFARRPCRGYMGPPMRWWKISRWKMMATYIYTYIYIYMICL